MNFVLITNELSICFDCVVSYKESPLHLFFSICFFLSSYSLFPFLELTPFSWLSCSSAVQLFPGGFQWRGHWKGCHKVFWGLGRSNCAFSVGQTSSRGWGRRRKGALKSREWTVVDALSLWWMPITRPRGICGRFSRCLEPISSSARYFIYTKSLRFTLAIIVRQLDTLHLCAKEY